MQYTKYLYNDDVPENSPASYQRKRSRDTKQTSHNRVPFLFSACFQPAAVHSATVVSWQQAGSRHQHLDIHSETNLSLASKF